MFYPESDEDMSSSIMCEKATECVRVGSCVGCVLCAQTSFDEQAPNVKTLFFYQYTTLPVYQLYFSVSINY